MWAPLLLAVVAMFAAACGEHCGSLAHRSAETRAQAGGIEVRGGSAADRRRVRAVIARSGETSIATVRFLQPRPWRLAPARLRHPVIEFRIRARTSAAAARGWWEATLIGAAYTDVAGAARHPSAIAYGYAGSPPRGTTVGGGSLPEIRPSRLPRRPWTSEGTIVAKVRDAASALGLELDQITLVRPLGFAVVARVEAPTSLSADDVARITLALTEAVSDPDDPLTDGAFYEIVEHGGALAAVTGYATRVGAGYGWRSPRHRTR